MPRATPTLFAALVGLPLTGAAAWLAVRADQTHAWMPAAGIGLGIAGVVLLRRALWHDPLRGRPRCPKCLYPFVPLQPESHTSVGGANKGLLITQTFEAVAADRTRVRTTVELPFPGMLFFLAPLVRMGLQRDVEAALEEDRVDLEQRGYPRR